MLEYIREIMNEWRRDQARWYIRWLYLFVVAASFFILKEFISYDRIINRIADWSIYLETILPRSEEHNSQDIVFLDIDAKKYQEWNYPSITPRDTLAEMIETACDWQAKLIFVDINFDLPTDRDEQMRRALTKIHQAGGTTKLIFAADVLPNQSLTRNVFGDFIDHETIYQACPDSLYNRYDHVTRYFGAYNIYKDEMGNKQILWSLPVLAAMLAKGNAEDLKPLSEAILMKEGAKQNEFQIHLTLKNESDSQSITTLATKNRIRYFIKPIEEIEDVGIGYHAIIDKQDAKHFIHKRLSQLRLHDPVWNELKGKIVILGSSGNAYDTARTPLGDMPGMFVQGNALNTLLTSSLIRECPLWIEFIITLLVCVIVVHFEDRKFLGAIKVLIILFSYLLGTAILQKYDVLFDLSVLILAIGWHTVFVDLHKLIKFASESPNSKNIIRFIILVVLFIGIGWHTAFHLKQKKSP